MQAILGLFFTLQIASAWPSTPRSHANPTPTPPSSISNFSTEALEGSFCFLSPNTDPTINDTRNDLLAGRCADILVIYARGTCDPGNIGAKTGPALFTALDTLLPGVVAVQGVNYPADVLGYLEGGSKNGSMDMANSVNIAAKQCPRSKIVLAGFRQ